MKIVATADLHGHLPEVPACDLLIIAGDVCPVTSHEINYQRKWLLGPFAEWLNSAPATLVVMVWGNHDLIAENNPTIQASLMAASGRLMRVLTDDLLEWEGLRIYGMPWSRDFFPEHWAFNKSELAMAKKCEAIPPCDILICHGPPAGYLDETESGEHVGFECLREAIHRLRPRLTVCGHIHENGGQMATAGQARDDRVNPPQIWNASYVDARYQPHPERLAVHEFDLTPAAGRV